MADNRQHNWRRRRSLLALLVALSLVAASCGDDDDDEAANTEQEGEEAEPEPVTLRFSWWGSDSRHEYTQELIDLYEAENPHVTIEPEFTEFEAYLDRLSTNVAGGDAPDVIQMDARWLREFANDGVLLELDDYFGEELDTSQLDESMLPTGQVDDATYAIPTGANTFSMMTDPAVFDAAGVEVPDDEAWTWEDYADVAAQISDASPDGTYGAQDMGFNETSLEIYLRQNGQELFNEDGTDLDFDAELAEEWWQISLGMRDSGAEPSAAESVEIQNGSIDQSLIATNRAGMATYHSNQLAALTAGAGRELVPLRWPSDEEGNTGMYLKATMYWSASAESDNPEEAVRFVDWLLNSQDAAELLLSDRGVHINTELREEISDQLGPADATATEFVAEVTPDLEDPPPVPPVGAGEVQDIIQRINEEVLFDRLSVEDAVQQFMDEARAAIGA
ncbi:MAG: ABC transporter substrate-binding protein [Acidimicrobiales bacterium]